MQCQICGYAEESINHVLFECALALQTWALSNILSCPGEFPTPSLFTNMDYLFWRLPKELDLNNFPWILQYIWKNRNAKVFQNQTRTPFDILRTTEIEGVLWAESQTNESMNRGSLHIAENHFPHGVNKCYIDGAWKEHDLYTGQGWVNRKDGSTDTMMGAMSIRRSLSP